jgi:hypothetical protein
MEPPIGGDLGETLEKRKFWEIFLVKYCNFIVNVDSLL